MVVIFSLGSLNQLARLPIAVLRRFLLSRLHVLLSRFDPTAVLPWLANDFSIFEGPEDSEGFEGAFSSSALGANRTVLLGESVFMERKKGSSAGAELVISAIHASMFEKNGIKG